MELIFAAVISLLTGAGLSLYLKTNQNRIIASVLSQSLAFIFVFIATAPVLWNGTELRGLVDWSFPVNAINLRIDPLSAFFLLFSIPMTLLGSIYAKGYLAPYFEKRRNAGIHFALLNMVSLSYILIYTVENGIAFLLGWELAAVSAWLLVIWDYRNQKIRFAGFNYLVSTHVGLLVLIAAFVLLHSSSGSFDFNSFAAVLSESGPRRNIIFLLLVTSFALKAAFFPFHTWLPRAHSAAPAHISALMSGVINRAGLYGILRFTLIMGMPDLWMGWYLIAFSFSSAFIGVLYTVTQRDIKRVLGYSSTEHVGIAGIGIGLGYLGFVWKQPALIAFGFSGAVLNILNHALFKCLLFYAAGCVYRMTHTVDLERLGGLIKKMPQTAALYLIGGLAISAVPPFNGFISEFLIYNGLLRDWHVTGLSQIALVAGAGLLSLIGAISAIAIVRSFGISFLGALRDPKCEPAGEAPVSMRIPMGIHALGIIILGFIPVLSFKIVMKTTELFLIHGDSAGLNRQALDQLSDSLVPLSYIGALLMFTILFIWFVRKFLMAGASRRHVTWACGYNAISTRMQYTGSSFSEPFIDVFRSLLRRLTRENLPRGLFPVTAYLNTHFVDAIERRMFKVIGEGEHLIESIAELIHEDSKISFAMGLVVILIAVTLFVVKNGMG